MVVARDGTRGFRNRPSYPPFDVIVLDVMLPAHDGIAVARKLREGRNQTPILMLTARDSAADIVKGLDSGADDYLTKPFSIDILLARLRAVSRRGAIARPSAWKSADVTARSGQPSGDPRPRNPRPDAPRVPAARIADAQSRPRRSAATRSSNRSGASAARSMRTRSKSSCACCASRWTRANRS